ncbi:MAG TPA: arylamine N-acetyltransferase [Steroidobacteraceae bacterium]|nr:arylamine N-acetyltransferase [Steroidobacteraceae bacterium]
MRYEELMLRYLQRLGLTRPPMPTWPTLCRLVSAHLECVPFENLDIVSGFDAALTSEATLHKVVIRRRGGFCYELNEAFGRLLAHLGFSVTRIEAQVWSPVRHSFGPPFDHLALVVALPEGKFLTDVGFGDNNRRPLRLPADSLTDISGHYSLQPATDGVWLLSRQDRPLYRMTLEPRELQAFEGMYRFHRSSPESFFGQGLICTCATRTGRVTMNAQGLNIVAGGKRWDIPFTDPDRVLEQYFGIVKEPTC